MKIIFAGTPEFAVAPLEALLQTSHEVVAVYTQPDRPAGRGKKLAASPVKECALAAGIRVCQPETLRDRGAQAELAAFEADLMIVAAYGLILPEAVLAAPRLGCINIHASLLPRWRGAAPIQRAIEAGDAETGITIMLMAKGLDTGDMLLKLVTPIDGADTGGRLHDRLCNLGAVALMQALPAIERQAIAAEAQDESQVTYAHKLDKTQARLDWSASASVLARRIRAFNPWPVCQCGSSLGDLRVWQAEASAIGADAPAGSVIEEHRDQGILVACGEGALWLQALQLPGKRPMPVRDFLNGRSLLGEILS